MKFFRICLQVVSILASGIHWLCIRPALFQEFPHSNSSSAVLRILHPTEARTIITIIILDKTKLRVDVLKVPRGWI